MECSAVSADHGASGVTSGDARTAPWQRLGVVIGLRRRVQGSPEPTEVDHLVAIEHIGFQGDKHANELSPRQVLVAGIDAYSDLGLKSNTLRENLLVSFSTEGLKSGGLVKIGRDVLLWLTFQCEACGHLEHHHPGIVRSIAGRRGMLARVLRGGQIFARDEVLHMESHIPPLANRWQDRIAGILAKVPEGKYLEFRQLARLAGVPNAYCRAFPKLLSKLPSALAVRARAGEIKEMHQRWTGAELFDVSEHVGRVKVLTR